MATLAPTPTVLGKVFDFVKNKKENADVLQNIVNLNKEQKYEELARYFLGLDEDFRKSRLLNLIAVQAANMTNDMTLYQQVLSNVEHYYGDDETLTLVLLDFYLLSHEYEKVIKATGRLQKAFGVEDPGIVTYAAEALSQQGKHEEAIARAGYAVKLEPEYEYSYWSLLAIQSKAKRYDRAVETAATLEEMFGYDLGPATLEVEEAYAGLLQSDDYRNWRKGL